MDTRPLTRRLDKMFRNRQDWEATWQTAYEYMAPERAVFTQDANQRPAGSIGEYIYDSTAIDAAERLANLILSGLTPPWRKWFRFRPGTKVRDPNERSKLQEPLTLAEDVVYEELRRSNLYQELQPMLLDRIVGGTGTMMFNLDDERLRFKAMPLAEVALEEDNAGEVSATARRVNMSFRDIERAWGGKVPDEWRRANESNPEAERHQVEMINARDADGSWQYVVRLKDGGHILDKSVDSYPRLLATRWTKLPGTPYGRGPGLRALPHVRALNKIKELSLQNAALAVAGVYTVVDDGVVNPWTLSLDPGDFIPVASNAPNEKTIAPLESSSNFDVAMWSFEELKASIQQIFLADQFGPLDATPRSATEVSERTNILAQELGSTISRLQFELLMPMLRSVVKRLGDDDRLPKELELDGETVTVEFTSRLSRAQRAEDEQSLLEYAQVVTQFGEVDPKAGMVLDVHKALREVAELRGVNPELLRDEEEIQQLMDQAAQAQAASEQEPGAAGGQSQGGGQPQGGGAPPAGGMA
ncbi:MAG: portal protein [Actinomycetota bacterium]